MLDYVRDGDTIYVHSMDRLARNLDDLRRLVNQLTEQQVRIEFLKEGLSFDGDDTPMSKLLLSVMGAFAEFERALIKERLSSSPMPQPFLSRISRFAVQTHLESDISGSYAA